MQPADLRGDGDDFVPIGDGIPPRDGVFFVLQFFVCAASHCRARGDVERAETGRGQRMGAQGKEMDAFGTGGGALVYGNVVGIDLIYPLGV